MQETRLFTCPECGQAFPVAESSAGETLPCPNCQKTITLPSLGALRDLPVQAQPALVPDNDKSVSELDRRIGAMIFLGAIALTFIIMSAIWGYRYYYYYTNINAIQYKDWDVIYTWEKWQFLRPGVDAPMTETEQFLFYQLRMLWKWLVIYLSIVVVCVAGIVILLIKPIRKEEKPLNNKL